MEKQISIDSPSFRITVLVFALIVLAGLSFSNFLLFHTIAEFFSIIVGYGIAAIALHTKIFSEENDMLNFFGIAYFFIATFDLVHTVAYNGMGVFAGDTSNLATQLWIIPRYLESITFLLVATGLPKTITSTRAFTAFAVISLGLGAAVFTGIFPDCYLTGTGLTLFKIYSEYIIAVLLLAAALFLIKKRRSMDPQIFRFMLLACVTTIFAELHFTIYIGVYDIANMIGHLWKVLSFYFIYEIIIRKKLLEPYETMADLYQNMERKVATRTRELEAANLRLREGQRVLKQLNQKLSENNRLKSEFMATVTHELRTPLTSIVAFCELLLDEAVGPLTEEQRENLLDISIGAQQLMILISDVLDMAKYEAGHLRLNPEKVDLNDVFHIVQRTMSPIAMQNKLSLEIEQVDMPLVYGDPERIRQMVINLISNAVKFTKEGGSITVSAAVEDEQAAISVKDTGEGIDPELLPYIFEKFRQGDSSLKRKRSGAGLGLALVKMLAELQNGSISVKSEIDVGTEFVIHLPLAGENDTGLADNPGSARLAL